MPSLVSRVANATAVLDAVATSALLAVVPTPVVVDALSLLVAVAAIDALPATGPVALVRQPVG